MSSTSDSEEETIMLYIGSCSSSPEKKRRKYWVHPTLEKREELGEFMLVKELFNYEDRFYSYFHLTRMEFEEILNLIKNDITKEDTVCRPAISATERLAVTLKHLITGDSFQNLSGSFRMGKTTVSEIVRDVCIAIWTKLQPLYMPEPTTEMLKNSAEEFFHRWNYPNCVGAVDGKHVLIQCPNNSGSLYFNYKKIFSFVLMALADANYCFTAIDVGGYGRHSDSGIFQHSNMGMKLKDGNFGLPPPSPLPGTTLEMPHIIVGDEAFPLSEFLMRPYPQEATVQCSQKRIYNYRHCRARRVVENAFGILVKKFSIFRRPLEVKVPFGIDIVKAACCLHNYLRKNRINQLHETNNLEEAEALRDFLPMEDGNISQKIRHNFSVYFTSDVGSVAWQQNKI